MTKMEKTGNSGQLPPRGKKSKFPGCAGRSPPTSAERNLEKPSRYRSGQLQPHPTSKTASQKNGKRRFNQAAGEKNEQAVLAQASFFLAVSFRVESPRRPQRRESSPRPAITADLTGGSDHGTRFWFFGFSVVFSWRQAPLRMSPRVKSNASAFPAKGEPDRLCKARAGSCR